MDEGRPAASLHLFRDLIIPQNLEEEKKASDFFKTAVLLKSVRQGFFLTIPATPAFAVGDFGAPPR